MLSVMIVSFLVLLAFGVPIAFALVLASAIYVATGGNIPLPSFPQRMVASVDSFTFMAIPFFLLAGEIMNYGGLTRRLVKFANGLVGWVRGGLAYVTIVVNMIMAGMSGSALADAAATGSILIPAMEKTGYKRGFASAIVAAAATIGPVIPPSIPLVLYAGIAGISVGRIFLAGAMPGIVMGLFMMVAVYFIASKRNYPRERRMSFREILESTKDAILALIMPLIILLSILTGVTTPTEGAVIAVVYSLFVSTIVYREVNLKDLGEILYKTSINSAIIMFIISAASQFGWVLGREQVPIKLQMFVSGLTDNPLMVLLLINILLIILGCFMEGNAIIIILTPILIPLLKSFNIDLIHFGVVLTLNMMIGLITPPVGMNLFVISKVADISLSEIVKELIPFGIALLVTLILATYVPKFVLWLPTLIIGS